MKYTINFKGRKNGAIGVCYVITDSRVANTPKEAVSALYNEYEHISQAVVMADNKFISINP